MRNPTGKPDTANKRWPQAIWVAPRESSRPKYFGMEGLFFYPGLRAIWVVPREGEARPKGMRFSIFI